MAAATFGPRAQGPILVEMPSKAQSVCRGLSEGYRRTSVHRPVTGPRALKV